jgi:hypothetical protein
MTASLDLTGCAGYRVETADGRIGEVAAVLPRRERAVPSVLIMQSDVVTCGLMVVPFQQIETVDHERKSLPLRDEVLMPRERAPSGACERVLTRA